MARNATIKVTVRFDDNGKYKYINALIRPDPQRKKPLLAFCEQKSVGTKNRSSAGEEFRSGGWRMFWGGKMYREPPETPEYSVVGQPLRAQMMMAILISTCRKYN